MEDNWFRYRNGGGLVCTAKEVHLSHIEAPERITCNEGETVTIDLKASVHFNTGRYDVGWYVGMYGGDALNGECYIQPLLEHDAELAAPKNVIANPRSNEVVGHVTWDDDAKGDNDWCGDVHMTAGGGGVLDFVSIGKGMQLECVDKSDNGYMDFGICFSWRQPGGDAECIPDQLFPGAPSKCFCTRYDIEQITVRKSTQTLEDC